MWKEHLFGNDDNLGLLKNLSKRIRILKCLRNYMPNNKFNQIVAGIFTSKLINCITVWGGVWGLPVQNVKNRRTTSITKQEMRKLQVIQNKAMRLMTGLDYNASTKSLLKSSNQLSVHQLVAYHTLCQVHKIKMSKLPAYHYERLFRKTEEKYPIRHKDKKVNYNLSLGRSHFFYQASTIYGLLPNRLKNIPKNALFKTECKKWVSLNIPIRP